MKGSINLDEATAVAQTGANNDKIQINLHGGTVIKVRQLLVYPPAPIVPLCD